MPTTRLAFTAANPGITLDGSTLYSVPTIPAPGANGWSTVALTATMGRIRRESMTPFVGSEGFLIRELGVFQTSEASFAIALRPPNGIVYAGGVANLDMVVGSFGSANVNFPDTPEYQQLPIYVPPGFEICIRCGDATFGSGTTVPFIGSFGFVLDTLRDFEEAVGAFQSLDVPRAAVVDWNIA